MKRQEAHERNYPLHLVGKTSLSNPTSPEHHALEGTKLHLALRRNYKQPKKPGKNVTDSLKTSVAIWGTALHHVLRRV